MITLNKVKKGCLELSDSEIVDLLRIDTHSNDFYELISASNTLSRKKFGNKGLVFTQIGINADACPVNCKFCSMGDTHYAMDSKWEKTTEEVKKELALLQKEYFDDFFMMSTANYPQDKFAEAGRAVKPLLRKEQKLVANIGDFDLETALMLKEAGFTGAYHINRLREGTDTMVKTAEREKTIRAIKDAGLDFYYCIEPIGPEHSYEELLVEIKRAKELEVALMAAMRRVAVKGTPLYEMGQITALELTKIVAVCNLVVNPSRAMNVHEPIQVALSAGVNQLYAEAGANPRDTDSHTEKSRGFTPTAAWNMLKEFGYVSNH